MIQFIIGEKGKGKTKVLLEKANHEVKEANGNFVYLDKNTQHMFELHNRVRLIDVTTYPLTDSDEFIGFLCGIISQDHDLENVYLDNFMKIARISLVLSLSLSLPMPERNGGIVMGRGRGGYTEKQVSFNFIISISLTKEDLPEEFRDMIIAEL